MSQIASLMKFMNIIKGGESIKGAEAVSNIAGGVSSSLQGDVVQSVGGVAGQGIGALIGTAVLPGIGTAIGAAIGGEVGSTVGQKIDENTKQQSSSKKVEFSSNTDITAQATNFTNKDNTGKDSVEFLRKISTDIKSITTGGIKTRADAISSRSVGNKI